jgi:hypothetical protein
LSGANAGLRVSSFAECNGRLYAAIGQQIYERIDGAAANWRLIYTNRHPGRSETGLRGLTPIPSPSGAGEMLLAAVEGNAARIVRVDPRDGIEATDLKLVDFLGRAWGMRVNYVIAAYNDMTKLQDSRGDGDLPMGLEAFVASDTPIAVGHSVVDVGYGRLESGGWHLARHADGRDDLHQIAADDQALVAIRSIRASPFAKLTSGSGGFNARPLSPHVDKRSSVTALALKLCAFQALNPNRTAWRGTDQGTTPCARGQRICSATVRDGTVVGAVAFASASPGPGRSEHSR